MRKAFLFFAMLLCFTVEATAQSYRYATTLLRQLAYRVRFSPDTAHFNNGICFAMPFRGYPVVVESDTGKVIRHVGLSLFSNDMKKEVKPQDADIMRFIERYVLDMMSQHDARLVDKMADDKVYFRKGNLTELANQARQLTFSLTKHPNYYEAIWSHNGNTAIDMVFPPKAELLQGATLVELQDAFKGLIQSASTKVLPEKTWEENELTKKDGGLWLTPQTHYVIAELNNALTLEKKQGKFHPVFDAEHKEASALNLALGAVCDKNFKLVIEQTLYGFKTVQYTATLNQWLNYCAQNRLRLYASVEEVREDGLKLFVLAENPNLGYNHVMSLVIPTEFCENPKTVLKATLTTYIPTDNVKNLYQNYKAKQKKSINYE